MPPSGVQNPAKPSNWIKLATEIESKRNNANAIVIIPGGILSLIGGAYLIKQAYSDIYVDVGSLFVAILLLCFSCLCFGVIYLRNKLVISDNSLRVLSAFGKLKLVIPLSEIKRYAEIERENKHSNWHELIIYTQSTSYRISSAEFDNYELMKGSLTKGKTQDRRAEKRETYRLSRNTGIGFTIIGVLIIFFGIFLSKQTPKLIPAEKLIYIQATLQNEITLKSPRKQEKQKDIIILLQEYPKFKFTLKASKLPTSTINQLLQAVKKGDTIKVAMLSEIYHKKLSETLPMSFWDRSFNYRKIELFGLQHRATSYFDLDQYNRNKLKPKGNSVYFFYFLGIIPISLGIFFIFKDRP